MHMRMLIITALFVAAYGTSCRQNGEPLQLATARIELAPADKCQQAPIAQTPQTSGIIFQTRDGGKTWEDIGAGLPEKFEPMRCFALNGELLMASERKGIYRRTITPLVAGWKNAQVIFAEGQVRNLFPLASGPVICNVDRTFFQEIGSSGIWKPAFNALQGKNVWCMYESGNALLTSWGEGIFRSTDGGGTWHPVCDENIHQVLEINGTLIAVGEKTIAISTDNGAHWEKTLPSQHYMMRVGRFDGGLFAIEDIRVGKTQFHTSDDNGKTWKAVDPSIFPFANAVDYVEMGDTRVCSHRDGISVSTDRGKTWTLSCKVSESGQQFLLIAANGVIYALKAFGC